jgi:cytochrome c
LLVGGVSAVKRFFIISFAASLFFAGEVSAENIISGADIGYGEYLSGECVTCHSQKGVNKGIPVINGLDAVMHAYKAGDIEHPVMQMVAGRLDGEQIASLAVYFATLSATE